MRAEDFQFAVQLTDRLNWELTKGDFEFMMELEPEGCFVLQKNSARIGLATNVSFGKIAWFGNLVVDEEHRNKGAGSLLVEHSINYLKSNGVQIIGLYAYSERIHFYERLGFTYDSDFSVLRGRSICSSSEPKVTLMQKSELDRIIKYDGACFGASRRKLLKPIILDPDNLCYVMIEHDKVLGYVAAKICGGVAELGPLACPEDRSDLAMSLLETILCRLKGLEVSMIVPKKESEAIAKLKALGFTERFTVARMFHGPCLVNRCTFMPESLERG